MEKPYYVPMFESMFQALKCLDSEDAVRVLDLIHDYYFDGVDPEEEQGAAYAVYLCLKPSLEKSRKLSESNRQNATKRAKKSEPKRKASDSKRTAAKTSQTKRAAANRSEILKSASRGNADEPEPEESDPSANRSETEPNVSELQRKPAKPSGGPAKASQTLPIKDKEKEEGEGEKVKSVARARRPPRPRAKFEPPDVQQADAYAGAYAASKGLKLDDLKWDPERFIDHFTANGWKVSGKAPMRDWHAAVRNWMKNDNPQLEGGATQDGWADQYVPEAIVVE